MGPSLAELLHNWRDFYVLVGTAAPVLVGLMFVAVSIGTTIFNEDRHAGMTAFVTSTVVHFAAVLFACLLVTIPTQNWHPRRPARGRRACRLDLLRKARGSDHHLAPLPGGFERPVVLRAPSLFGLCACADIGRAVFMQSSVSANLIAAAVLTLLLAAMRNAWDMMVWIVIKTPSGGVPPP
jgi:hypothetical protein